jgi:hypothetical protein
VCQYCHEHKFIDAGHGGIFETSRAVSAAARHLEERKTGHSHRAPSKPAIIERKSFIQRVFTDGKIRVSQEVANDLPGFNTHYFRLAAVSWLVDSDHPLSEFETPAFRNMIALANPEAEVAL